MREMFERSESSIEVQRDKRFRRLSTKSLDRTKLDSAKTCVDCAQWIGRCLKGKIGKAASSIACESFELKKGVNKHG